MSPELEKFLQDHDHWRACPDMLVNPPTAEELSAWHPELDRELLDRCEEVIPPGVTRGAVYARMRMAGESHKLSEMVALQRCVGLDTDDVFFSGQKPLYDQFESQKNLDRYLKTAKRHGHTPSVQSTYFPNLARFPGDPEAFVTRAQGRSYIRELCRTRGWACEGGVNVDSREPDSDPLSPENCQPMGEDIIRDRAASMIARDPSLKQMDRRELRQSIVATHGPSDRVK